MVVGVAPCVGEKALITAACDNCRLTHRHNAEIACGVVRVLHGNVPVRAVRLQAEGLHIAAERDDAACHTGLTHGLNGVVSRTALCHSGKAQLTGRRDGNRERAGGRELRQHKLIEAEAGQILRNLSVCRHVIFPVKKAPALIQRINRQIQRALALLIDGVRGAEHVRNLPGDNGASAVRVVYGVYSACGKLRVKRGVHRENDALRGIEPLRCFLAVGGQGHNGVHGVNLALGQLGLTAGGEGQNHSGTQCYANELYK